MDVLDRELSRIEEHGEPFSKEAQYEIESRFLGRDVEVEILLCDKSGNLFGTVSLIQEPTESDKPSIPIGPTDPAKFLLEAGLADYISWTASSLKNPQILKNAEENAKRQRRNKWKSWKPPQQSQCIIYDPIFF